MNKVKQEYPHFRRIHKNDQNLKPEFLFCDEMNKFHQEYPPFRRTRIVKVILGKCRVLKAMLDFLFSALYLK